jgi:redox-sensitive bicupin YhaK (pirin superfamily)
MITLRRSEERRHLRQEGQETWRTFDGDSPSDPFRRGFRALESLNEERLAPGVGFLLQPQKDLEVLTYVQEGALIEEERSGKNRALELGECRHFSARSGTRHLAVNRSRTEYARAFQSCTTLGPKDSRCRDEQKRFPFAGRRGMLRIMASPDGKQESLRMRQDVRIYSSLLDPGHHLIHELAPSRAAWLHVVQGRIQLVDHILRAGDGASLVDEPAVSWTAQEASEILLFDLA